MRPQKPCRVPSLLRLMKVGAGGGDDHDDDDDDDDDVDEDDDYSLFIIIYQILDYIININFQIGLNYHRSIYIDIIFIIY